VTTDLSYFDLMVPCGIADVTMTSVARELRTAPDDFGALESRVRTEVVAGVAGVFGLEPASFDVGRWRGDAATQR
jgi:lipoate-protein ligase B